MKGIIVISALFSAIALMTLLFYLGTEGYIHRNSAYIPNNLEECFIQLRKILTKEQLNDFRSLSEDEVIRQCHLGLGMWIRNYWGLWKKSRLAKYFNNMGIFHPDDMSGIILLSFHRHLHEKDIRLREQLKVYHWYWKGHQSSPGPIETKRSGSVLCGI